MNAPYAKAFKWLTVFGITTSMAFAAIPEEKAKELDADIEKDMGTALVKLVNEKELAVRYEFEYPVPPPKKTLAEVQQLVEKTIDKMAIEKFPKKLLDEGMAKEAHRYALWSEGDMVKGKTKDAKAFKGFLRKVNQTNIQVDAQKIPLKELEPDTYVHLDSRRSREMRDRIRKRLVNELIAKRTRHKTEIRLDQTRIIYRAQGYIRVAGKWVPKQEFFKIRIADEQNRFRKLLQTDLKYKHYYNGGFRIYKGEWYTPEEVARLRLEDFIKEELRPVELMAELDSLNKEGMEGIISGGVKDLFGDENGKKDGEKKDDDLGDF
jgi:hypothetical protein